MKKLILITTISLSFVACKEAVKEAAQPEAVVEEVQKTKTPVNYASLGIDEAAIPQGLNVGDVAPEVDFTTSENKKVALATYYEKQPVVVIFYRGYWCPVCNKHLSEFAKKAKKIEDTGAKLIVVTPESYDNVGKTKKQTGANFTIISDVDDNIMRAFGVNFKVTSDYQAMIQDKLNASIAETNANKLAELPVPATYIIDKSGKIVFKQFDPDYKNRASVDDILSNLPK